MTDTVPTAKSSDARETVIILTATKKGVTGLRETQDGRMKPLKKPEKENFDMNERNKPYEL